MIDCNFQLNADGLWQCPDCGWVFPRKSAQPPRRNCPKKRPHYTEEQLNKMRAEQGVFYGVPPTPEQKAEEERQQKEAIEIGEKLGWEVKHAIKYAGALSRWIAAGRPTRSDEEVEEIVARCEDCDKYKADEKRCRVCGCAVSTGGLAIFNKARLATERCPKDKW